MTAAAEGADGFDLPAGVPADEASLRRLDVLLSAAVCGMAAVEAEAAARGYALRAGVVFDAGAPVVLLDLVEAGT